MRRSLTALACLALCLSAISSAAQTGTSGKTKGDVLYCTYAFTIGLQMGNLPLRDIGIPVESPCSKTVRLLNTQKNRDY